MRNALKAVAAAFTVIVLCAPLIFWPADVAQPTAQGLAEVTVTVPQPVLVATTLSPSQTTTTVASVEPTSTTTTTEAPISITIAAVGDVLTHLSIVNSVKDWETGSYDFRPVFAPIAAYLARADYAVANLETRLGGAEAGYSGYPRFNSPDSLAYALRMAGVDLVATANNHSLDLGWDGIVRTLDTLDTAGLAHVGTYRSGLEKATPVIVNIRGIRVAFLNYTSYLNGLLPPAEHAAYAVNALDAEAVAQDAMIARLWGADAVIALLHWGREYEREPSTAQLDLAQEILSHGVDVILGSHPHVVQPIAHSLQYARGNDKYVVYSLGNFVSAQTWRYSDSGLIAYVHLQKKGLRTSVTGVSYLPVYVQRSTAQAPLRYRVLPVFPGLEPETDAALTERDKARMDQVWEELRAMLYRPDENIAFFSPGDLGL